VPTDTSFPNAPLPGTCTVTIVKSTGSTLPRIATNQPDQGQRVAAVKIQEEGKDSPAIRPDLGVKVSSKSFEPKTLKEREQENFERERGKLEQYLTKEKAKRDADALLLRKTLRQIQNKFCVLFLV